MVEGARKFILAVDDDESIRDLYGQQLPMLGYDVFCAKNGKEAREALKARTPALILMDVMMEGEDGLSLTREFRTRKELEQAPIIVVSALLDAAVLSDALTFGATDYMTKPFDYDTLKLKLERAFLAVERARKAA